MLSAASGIGSDSTWLAMLWALRSQRSLHYELKDRFGATLFCLREMHDLLSTIAQVIALGE